MNLTTFATLAALVAAIAAAPQSDVSRIKNRQDPPASTTTTTAKVISQSSVAGIVISQPPSDDDLGNDADSTYADVTAHFVVPTVQDKNIGRAFASVGIDGFYGLDQIWDGEFFDPDISTGIVIETVADGTTTYSPYYRWFISPRTYFNPNSTDGQPFVINPGDELTFAISILPSLNSAMMIITNAKSGLTLEETISAPEGTYARGKSAEFLMQRDVIQNAPLLNFGTVNFTKCAAITRGGQSADLSGGSDGSTTVPVHTLNMIKTNNDTTALASVNNLDESTDQTVQIVWENSGST
ncbi:hypothetical protein NHQ30_006767 [Ciborinia camelliae]|nr:hypothetical protein NHQ30_006767 [Ciborinia camelliae]